MTKVLILTAVFTLAATTAWAQSGVYVNGYTRSNGTYVAPYYRSAPDSNYNNNYGVRPNVNPYTGQAGTQQPTLFGQQPSRGGGLFDSFDR